MTQPTPRATAPLMAFLVMCFLVLGLLGLFASYASAIPYERAMAQDAALDQALAGDASAGLRDRLGDSASAVLDGPGPLADRVAAARTAMHAAQQREAAAIASRLRLMLAVVTVMAAGFGALLLGLAARR